jgi:hypothetical protein
MIDILNPTDAERVTACTAFFGGDPHNPAHRFTAGGAGDVITPHGDRWVKTIAEIADQAEDREDLVDALCVEGAIYRDDAGVTWLISIV